MTVQGRAGGAMAPLPRLCRQGNALLRALDASQLRPACRADGHAPRTNTTCGPPSSLEPSAMFGQASMAVSALREDPVLVTEAASANCLPPAAAYVHLPFCKRRCYYCDFPVSVVGSRTAASDGVLAAMASYVDVLCEEIEATASFCSQAAEGSPLLQTVFFGGGTPSLIPPHLLERILEALRGHYGIADGAEVSMEADPGTFDEHRLHAYMALGVTRFSVGVQAFQQELLEVCGRSHSLADVEAALAAVRTAAPVSWSLDLMSGLPRLTPAAWEASLAAAIAAGPDHISVYDLQVEQRTPFGRWFTPGQAPMPSDMAAADMFRAASDTLRAAGYEHYEISNYARAGHRCRHNLVYWDGRTPYLAFGVGAASLLAGQRFSRPRTLPAYKAWVGRFCAVGHGNPGWEEARQECDADQEQLLDVVMLRLRLADGLSLGEVASWHGDCTARTVERALQRHVRAGLVELVHSVSSAADENMDRREEAQAAVSGHTMCQEGTLATASQLCQTRLSGIAGKHGWQTLRLSDPEGFLVSNDIISDVFAALTHEQSQATDTTVGL